MALLKAFNNDSSKLLGLIADAKELGIDFTDTYTIYNLMVSEDLLKQLLALSDTGFLTKIANDIRALHIAESNHHGLVFRDIIMAKFSGQSYLANNFVKELEGYNIQLGEQLWQDKLMSNLDLFVSLSNYSRLGFLGKVAMLQTHFNKKG